MRRKIMQLAIVLAFALAAIGIAAGSAWAVPAPSTDTREKAEKHHQKAKKERIKEERSTGCQYGKDKKTGKCYQPKEGQFYEDSQGNVHVKEMDCVNLPWKPCGGKGAKPAEKEKKPAKKKEK